MRRLFALLAAFPALAPVASLACSGAGGGTSGPSTTTFSIQDLTSQAAGSGFIGLGGFLATAAVVAASVIVMVALLGRPASDVAVPVPLTAPRSPDGHYWWDGQSWRPLSSR